MTFEGPFEPKTFYDDSMMLNDEGSENNPCHEGAGAAEAVGGWGGIACPPPAGLSPPAVVSTELTVFMHRPSSIPGAGWIKK